MIQLRIEAKIVESKQSEFEQSVHYIIKSKLQKFDGKNHRIFKEMDDSGCIKYTEEWDDLDNLYRYIQSDDFKSLMGAMEVLGEISSAKIIKADKVENII
jgi:hypothetical protein